MTTFRPDPSFESEMAPEAKAALMDASENAASHAKTLMPLGKDPRHGHTRDKIKAREVDGQIQVAIDNDSFGHLAEFGSVHNPAYAPLRRGVRAAGLRLDEAPKP